MSGPESRRMSLGLAILPVVTLLGAVVAGALAFGFDGDVLVLTILVAAAVAGAVAILRGASWSDIERETGSKIATVLPVLLILLAIGALIGTWVLSGTIPMLVSLGVELISPRFFVLTTFLVTCLMSICTGTSWGSAGTLGVALMGAGAALGAPLDATAGAVVSGAYFGDKLSPLSDSTNICALSAGANLYAHIRHMLYTSVPSFVVAALVFAIFAAPANGDATTAAAAARLVADVDAHFSTGLVVWLPLLVVLVGVIVRKPPVLVLASSSVVAIVVGVLVQGFTLKSALLSSISGFHTGMFPVSNSTGAGELFLALVNRGGMYSMALMFVTIFAAFLMVAAMQVSGAVERILAALLGGVRSTFALIATTMAAGATLVAMTSNTSATALIVGGMFKPAYAARKLATENLSRTLEDSVTMTEALMPWTVSALFFATTLGVGTLEYAPWAVFNWCSPLASLALAALSRRWGFGIRRSV